MLCYTVTMLCIQRAQFPYLACYQTYQTWKENKIDITLLLVFLQMRKIRLNKAISFSSISFFSPLALWPNFKLARKGRRPLHDLTINSLMHFFKIHPDSCHFVRSSKLPIFCQLFCFFSLENHSPVCLADFYFQKRFEGLSFFLVFDCFNTFQVLIYLFFKQV